MAIFVSSSRSLGPVPGVPLAGSRLAPSGSPVVVGGRRGWVGVDLPGAIPASCPLSAAPS